VTSRVASADSGRFHSPSLRWKYPALLASPGMPGARRQLWCVLPPGGGTDAWCRHCERCAPLALEGHGISYGDSLAGASSPISLADGWLCNALLSPLPTTCTPLRCPRRLLYTTLHTYVGERAALTRTRGDAAHGRRLTRLLARCSFASLPVRGKFCCYGLRATARAALRWASYRGRARRRYIRRNRVKRPTCCCSWSRAAAATKMVDAILVCAAACVWAWHLSVGRTTPVLPASSLFL